MFNHTSKKFWSSTFSVSIFFLLIVVFSFPFWEPSVTSANEVQTKISLQIAHEISSEENEKLATSLEDIYSTKINRNVSLVLTDY